MYICKLLIQSATTLRKNCWCFKQNDVKLAKQGGNLYVTDDSFEHMRSPR